MLGHRMLMSLASWWVLVLEKSGVWVRFLRSCGLIVLLLAMLSRGLYRRTVRDLMLVKHINELIDFTLRVRWSIVLLIVVAKITVVLGRLRGWLGAEWDPLWDLIGLKATPWVLTWSCIIWLCKRDWSAGCNVDIDIAISLSCHSRVFHEAWPWDAGSSSVWATGSWDLWWWVVSLCSCPSSWAWDARFLLSRSWSSQAQGWLVELYFTLGHIAAILVLPLKVLVLDEGRFWGVLLLTFVSDLFIFFGNLALLKLFQLLLILLSRCIWIFAFRIQLPLEHFCMWQLVRIVNQGVVPTRSRLEVRRRLDLTLFFLLSRLCLPTRQLFPLQVGKVGVVSLLAHFYFLLLFSR